MWSRSMLVITAQSASTMFTASRRPPRPTSRIARSSFDAAMQAHDGQRGELEVGQRDVLPRGLDPLEMRHQRLRRDDLAVDAAALLEMHEVRRGVDAGAIARLQRDRLQHGAGRALAVGAGHGDHRAVEAQAHPRGHGLHALQAQLYRLGVQAFAVRQPVLQGFHGPHCPSTMICRMKSSMNIVLYGIPNCDTVKKARAWLDGQRRGLPIPRLQEAGRARPSGWTRWISQLGWERLVNRKARPGASWTPPLRPA